MQRTQMERDGAGHGAFLMLFSFLGQPKNPVGVGRSEYSPWQLLTCPIIAPCFWRGEDRDGQEMPQSVWWLCTLMPSSQVLPWVLGSRMLCCSLSPGSLGKSSPTQMSPQAWLGAWLRFRVVLVQSAAILIFPRTAPTYTFIYSTSINI